MSNYFIGADERAQKAKDHTDEMENKYSDRIQKSLNETKVYTKEVNFNRDWLVIPAGVEVRSEDSVSTILSTDENDGKVAVLNFASYKNPGGMFINGSSAQEESLCHESFLYNVLKEETEYYEYNNQRKNRSMYTNRALYTPGVVFERNNKNRDCDVITCAAPNYTAGNKYLNVSREENDMYLRERIDFVCDIAEENQVDTLILGAYGCGVFGQDANTVAEMFKDRLAKTTIRKVIYSIPDKRSSNYKAFDKVFALSKKKENSNETKRSI